MTVICLTLPEPPSANRWWRNVSGRMVTSKAARDYKAAVLDYCVARGLPMWADSTPIGIEVDWYRARRSGDLDKRLGVLLDALQGCVYQNDSQVVEIHAKRLDPDYDVALKGCVIVTVTCCPSGGDR